MSIGRGRATGLQTRLGRSPPLRVLAFANEDSPSFSGAGECPFEPPPWTEGATRRRNSFRVVERAGPRSQRAGSETKIPARYRLHPPVRRPGWRRRFWRYRSSCAPTRGHATSRRSWSVASPHSPQEADPATPDAPGRNRACDLSLRGRVKSRAVTTGAASFRRSHPVDQAPRFISDAGALDSDLSRRNLVAWPWTPGPDAATRGDALVSSEPDSRFDGVRVDVFPEPLRGCVEHALRPHANCRG